MKRNGIMPSGTAKPKNYQQRHSRENGNPERNYIVKNIRLNEKHFVSKH
jgi:hypothetical protein